MAKQYGKWQKGDYNNLTSLQLSKKFLYAGRGVMKPTAVQKSNGRWRIYHKPFTLEEGY
jgi:hypothetical protein